MTVTVVRDAQGSAGSPAFATQLMQQQQMQPQQLLQCCHTLADVSDALQAVQGYADPAVRGHLIKELKQKQYKVITVGTFTCLLLQTIVVCL
jgi:hemoglobin-like flavoprotein